MIDFASILTADGLVSLLTLTLLEIILGIDNIIFIAIVSSKLPKIQQASARGIGLTVALLFRVILLFGISFIIGLKATLFKIMDFEVTGRDIILFAGGVFLVVKTIIEIGEKIYDKHSAEKSYGDLTMKSAIAQIIFLDVIFSFDSILTAVGLVRNVMIMILAVVIAMIAMLIFSGKVSDFIEKHPTVKMLALAFLVMIGFALIAESFHLHVEKAYIYFSLVFSILVEALNMAYRSQSHRRK
jgi:predicted tellurium resistance membrane protein TerC